MKYKVIVCDHIHQRGLDLLSTQSDVEMENLASIPKMNYLAKFQVLMW